MRLYLDASVIVALVAGDNLADQADALLAKNKGILVISDFAAVEVASAIGKRVRMRLISEQQARQILASFDLFTGRTGARIETLPADLKAAEAILRQLDLPLRTGDALNIAIADRVGATLATFDRKMAIAARALRMAVVGDEEAAG